ncbi:hypothetical protein [Flavobacterium sp.]|jgi:ppGpp synthetase/RelA/SpoT-type nucleotidyltranferase|uniref:GTP pyrophosphokinase n=1 Tax=Flavobacterium sp. TaxID=239 RepID=UPI0031DCB6DB
MIDIQNEYLKIKSDYDDFLNEVMRTVGKLLNRNQIPIAFDVLGRTKSLESIIEKSQRVDIKKSITDFHDIVGLRIVLLFPEFKEKVVELLCHEFKLLNDPSKTQQKPDSFGYSSIHLILGIKEQWASTPDWEGHGGKKIEIQIRTVSEHIWAETSHTLFYKREENIPNIIKRDLSRVSALLEVVDEKLQSLKQQVEEHFNNVKQLSYEEILKMDLNSETFRRVMLKNSNNIYDYSDYKNKELSSRVEHDYNIVNINLLETLIAGNIDISGLNSSQYVDKVIYLLEQYKEGINQSQQEKDKQK